MDALPIVVVVIIILIVIIIDKEFVQKLRRPLGQGPVVTVQMQIFQSIDSLRQFPPGI